MALVFHAGIVPAGKDKCCIIQRKALVLQAADSRVSAEPAGIPVTLRFSTDVNWWRKSAPDQPFVPRGCAGFGPVLALPLGISCQGTSTGCTDLPLEKVAGSQSYEQPSWFSWITGERADR